MHTCRHIAFRICFPFLTHCWRVTDSLKFRQKRTHLPRQENSSNNSHTNSESLTQPGLSQLCSLGLTLPICSNGLLVWLDPTGQLHSGVWRFSPAKGKWKSVSWQTVNEQMRTRSWRSSPSDFVTFLSTFVESEPDEVRWVVIKITLHTRSHAHANMLKRSVPWRYKKSCVQGCTAFQRFGDT